MPSAADALVCFPLPHNLFGLFAFTCLSYVYCMHSARRYLAITLTFLLTRFCLLSATARSFSKDIKLQNVFLYRTVVQEGQRIRPSLVLFLYASLTMESYLII